MKIIEKLISFIKKIFNKQEEIKQLEEPKINTNISNARKRNEFIEGLKVVTKANKKVETLVCNGDGLGIQGKIGC